MVTAPNDFKTGAGLHSGPVVIGNVGSAEKMEFTVLGDTVNLASQLESMNKEQKSKLLLSESTRELLHDQIEVKCLGSVSIRGKTLPMKIYTAAILAATLEDYDTGKRCQPRLVRRNGEEKAHRDTRRSPRFCEINEDATIVACPCGRVAGLLAGYSARGGTRP